MLFRSPAATALAGSFGLAAAAGLAMPQPAQASMIQKLYPQNQNSASSPTNGSARGTYFTVDTSFTSQGAGVNANLSNGTSYDFQIYENPASGQDSGSAGSAALTRTFNASSNGTVKWNDTIFNTPFTFQNNTDYILLFRTSNGGSLPASDDLPLFGNQPNDTSDDFSIGNVTVEAGRSQPDASDGNGAIPELRLLVPEPASGVLMLMGIGGLLFRRR